jgi:predicted Zn-dependent protease
MSAAISAPATIDAKTDKEKNVAVIENPLAQPKSNKHEDTDVVLRAFKDELARTQARLKLEGHPPPYFTSYTAVQEESYNVFASFGALDRRDQARDRWLDVDLRLGDRKFDSGSSHALFDRAASIDDNYDALRHDLWLKTDSSYKRAIEGLEAEKAVLQQKKIMDLPDAMTQASPVVSIQPKVTLDVDKDRWDREVRESSAIFKAYPSIINSEVAMLSHACTRWFANSEGTVFREGDRGAVLGILATAQAKDGMAVADFELFGSTTPAGLPDIEHLTASTKGLAERLLKLSDATILEDYRGPVLFEKQAAAEFFAQTLSPNLCNPNEKLSRMSSGMFGLKERLGRRILPTTVTVVDDPLATTFGGVPLKGGYLVDDEGVKAQKVVLVQNGILKTLCSGRTPSRYVKETNGHWHNGAATPSQLFITASQTLPFDQLKRKLIQMGKDDGLQYVLIVRRITSLYLRLLNAGEPGFKGLGAYLRPDQVSLAPPTLLYKVNVEDGSEELVRGARFEHLSTRVWRDIVAFGDDPAAYIVMNAVLTSANATSLVTPSFLVSELDLGRWQHETDKPMLLKNPYFDRSSITSPGDVK